MRHRHAVRWWILPVLAVACCAALQNGVLAQPPSRLPSTEVSSLPLVDGPLGPSVLLEPYRRGDDPYRQIASSPELNQPLLDDDSPEAGPPGARDGVFQKLNFNYTWLPAFEAGDLGVTDLELNTVWGFPLPTRDSPLLITPGFGVHFFDGPATPDLPGQVYDAWTQFRWLRPVSERWVLDVAVTPGVYSDFEIDDSDAFRLTGRGIGIFKWTPQTTLILGVTYLDRDDISILPVGGLIWKPNDCLSVEIVVPRPRVAWRIDGYTSPGCPEYWAYLAGEFGGGQWSIRRASGAQDTMTMRDYRILFGLEHKVPAGLTTRAELGYVFGRTIEYKSATPDFNPGDTLLFRLGATY